VNPTLKSRLKSQAHSLKPVVMIAGGGLTEGVHNEIERALDDHELIKIRISGEDRDIRKTLASEIVATHRSDLIGSIGHIVIIYRKRPDKKK